MHSHGPSDATVVVLGGVGLEWPVESEVQERTAGARWARGRAAAVGEFEEFIALRGASLVRMARGLLRDPQHAEDVVQDVLVKALMNWSTIRNAGNPDAYVRRMLVNASTSFWRRAVRREFAVDGPLPAPAAEAAGGLEERDYLLSLLRTLPARQRAVLVLRHYEGLSDQEIAVLMDTTLVTVRSNAHRGLAKLRRLIEQEGTR